MTSTDNSLKLQTKPGNPPDSTGNLPPDSTGNRPLNLQPETKFKEDFKKCSAYDNLHTKLGNQCLRYSAFHSDEMLGSIPGMYKTNEFGEKIPNGLVSDYFRGGIISTMAIFEAFIVDLLKEACELSVTRCKLQCEYKKQADTNKCKSGHIILETNNSGAHKKIPVVLFHYWDSEYAQVLLKNKIPFTDYLFRSFPDSDRTTPAPITYTYIIEEQHYSEVKIGTRRRTVPFNKTLPYRTQQRTLPEFEDSSAICAILRLFYGIRCVMAHGDPEKTLDEGALKDFPHCSDPGCHSKMTAATLEDSMDLVLHLEKYIKKLKSEEKRDQVDNDIRRIPTHDKFKKLQTDLPNNLEKPEWDDVFKIIEKHFNKGESTDKPAAYAYFHMCRVARWLRKKERNMYITYRLLVRINQFIHMLAFRMYIAVAEILIRIHGLEDGTWGIEIGNKDSVDELITEFEKTHKNIVTKAHNEVKTKANKININDWIEERKLEKIDKDEDDYCKVLIDQSIATTGEVTQMYVAILKKKKKGGDSIIPSMKSFEYIPDQLKDSTDAKTDDNGKEGDSILPSVTSKC